MSCPALALETGTSLAELLRALDCRTGEATASAFGRLFGESGALLPALTILLTLYVAIFAIQLLTGRARVGVSALTPRMLTLGLALTFATSWMAYQNTVWTLATGAPDQIASVIAGTRGSATDAFAKRLDVIFDTLADSAQDAARTGGTPPQGAAPGQSGAPAAAQASGLFTPGNLLYGSGLMLLVGTLGVLVTAKIGLAALLAVGPVFIILALFRGTRGLFEGWLKGVVMFALVPMFAVLIGGGTLALVTPLIRAAIASSDAEAMRAATALFLAACVYIALMVMVVKTAGMLVSGWRLGRGEDEGRGQGGATPGVASVAPQPLLAGASGAPTAANERARALVASLPPVANDVGGAPGGSSGGGRDRPMTVHLPTSDATLPRLHLADRRAPGVGSRFRAPVARPKDRLS